MSKLNQLIRGNEMRAKRTKIDAETARHWCIEAARLTETKGGYYACDIKVPGANVYNIAAQKLKWAEKPKGNRRFKWTYEVDISVLTGERLNRGYQKYYATHPAKKVSKANGEDKQPSSRLGKIEQRLEAIEKSVVAKQPILTRLDALEKMVNQIARELE